MKQTILEITLVYSNGSSWFAGSFNSQENADAWVALEKTRPYWDINTQVQIVDKSTETDSDLS